MSSTGANANGQTDGPICLHIKHTAKRPSWQKPFPVIGQGVLVFNIKRATPFAISVQEEEDKNWISLDIHEHCAAFYMKSGGTPRLLQQITAENCGLEINVKTTYWYSYDRERLVLKYGKGYRMEETTLMVHDFLKGVSEEKEQSNIRRQLSAFFNPEKRIFAMLYDTKIPTLRDRLYGTVEDTEPEVEFEKNPFVCNIPPLVMDSSKVNLFFLDEGDFVFSASLPHSCKELYQNVKNCELNYAEEVDQVRLSDAIRHSIQTWGCLLYNKLEEKAGEFGPDASPHENYLRVTLGHSLGKSPGVPYVLELWPSKNFSPIHNHGNANAVIKVLFGSIQIRIFNKHTTDPNTKPLKVLEANSGNITWINRNWYQTHQLRNVSEDFCATVQCYSYDEGDTTHWPYFDYLADRNTIQEFLPTSDFGFKEMRDKVVEEYKAYQKEQEEPIKSQNAFIEEQT